MCIMLAGLSVDKLNEDIVIRTIKNTALPLMMLMLCYIA